jgi:hypothetical protein
MKKAQKRKIYLITMITASCLTVTGIKFIYNKQSAENKQLQQQAHNAYVDFDTSMQTNAYANFMHSQRGHRQELEFFRALYNRHSFKKVAVHNECKIP